MESKVKFYLCDNLEFILSHGFFLAAINIENDDFGQYKAFVFVKDANTRLVVPYKKLCYNNLQENEYFLKKLEEAIK